MAGTQKCYVYVYSSCSLVPRPSHHPVFDRLQYAKKYSLVTWPVRLGNEASILGPLSFHKTSWIKNKVFNRHQQKVIRKLICDSSINDNIKNMSN